MLGVSFDGGQEGPSPELVLHPEPLFCLPTEGVSLTVVPKQPLSPSRRIFFGGKDGCLYEFLYKAKVTMITSLEHTGLRAYRYTEHTGTLNIPVYGHTGTLNIPVHGAYRYTGHTGTRGIPVHGTYRYTEHTGTLNIPVHGTYRYTGHTGTLVIPVHGAYRYYCTVYCRRIGSGVDVRR